MTKHPITHVIITGGTGYIGRRLVLAALESGRTVTLLGRTRGSCANPAINYVAWSLGDPLPIEAINSQTDPAAQAIIHLAHDWTNGSGVRGMEGELNIESTRSLVDEARRLQVGRFVFASSQSARADAPNIYGRVKWATEQLLHQSNEVSARIGLAYGGPPKAMYGLLRKLSGISPILPMVDPGRLVQPIHIDELADGILRLTTSDLAGWVGLASERGVRFGDFLKAFARTFYGSKLRIIPVPLKLALLACDLTAAIPFVPTVDRERILGLAGTQFMPCSEHLQQLGLKLGDYEFRLRSEPGARKAMLLEGRTLLRYLLGAWPSHSPLRLYVRALYATGKPQALVMPLAIRLMPSLLRWVEPFDRQSTLYVRLGIAAAIAQSSPEGGIILSGKTVFSRNMTVFLSAAVDALALPIRVLFRRFWS